MKNREGWLKCYSQLNAYGRWTSQSMCCWSGLELLTRFTMETLVQVCCMWFWNSRRIGWKNHGPWFIAFIAQCSFQLQWTSFQQIHGVSHRINWSQWSGESDSSSHWSEARICQQLQLWLQYCSLIVIGDGLFIPGWGIAHCTIQDSVMAVLPRHLVWTGPCQRWEGRRACEVIELIQGYPGLIEVKTGFVFIRRATFPAFPVAFALRTSGDKERSSGGGGTTFLPFFFILTDGWQMVDRWLFLVLWWQFWKEIFNREQCQHFNAQWVFQGGCSWYCVGILRRIQRYKTYI